MEIFAGAIGALDYYSILKQVRLTHEISFKLEHSYHFHSCTSARGQMLEVCLLTNKIASSFSVLCYQCVE